MARVKLKRFLSNTTNPIIIQPGKDAFSTIKGHWNADFFRNPQNIVVELACGKGEFTVNLAQKTPNSNFIGVDIKGSRLFVGAQEALEKSLNNVGFLRTKIQNLGDFFELGEINELWLTFPDPRPKDKDARRRLTHPRFLEMYKKLMAPNGIIHLKTDDYGLFTFTKETILALGATILCETEDFYNSPYAEAHFGITTYFEKKFTSIGKKITYLKFILN